MVSYYFHFKISRKKLAYIVHFSLLLHASCFMLLASCIPAEHKRVSKKKTVSAVFFGGLHNEHRLLFHIGETLLENSHIAAHSPLERVVEVHCFP